MKKSQIILAIAAVFLLIAISFGIAFALGAFDKDEGEEVEKRVLLISIDGMRPDAVNNTEYGKHLQKTASYSLSAKTVFPSITLPCHMSMFHSVVPELHGVVTNEYTPSDTLGFGIAEALSEAGKSSAIFYNWGPMGTVVTEGSVTKSEYIDGYAVGWEESNALLGEACIEYLNGTPADFTYLYLGFLDEVGHAHGWLSEEYYYALGESLALVERVIAALPDGYTVIITSDHGGHGTGHGADIPEDMTIPVFVIGDGYAPGAVFTDASILDVAPTVLSVLGIEQPQYWQGDALPNKEK